MSESVVPTPSKQPMCKHGYDEGHDEIRITPITPTGRRIYWCPGPVVSTAKAFCWCFIMEDEPPAKDCPVHNGPVIATPNWIVEPVKGDDGYWAPTVSTEPETPSYIPNLSTDGQQKPCDARCGHDNHRIGCLNDPVSEATCKDSVTVASVAIATVKELQAELRAARAKIAEFEKKSAEVSPDAAPTSHDDCIMDLPPKTTASEATCEVHLEQDGRLRI